MIVAIIPARGGSKRVPRKNIREFHGRPMIAWPIEAAKRSGCFDRIIVSTDDEEIARIALAEGVEVPFMRPDELSDDFTGTVPVIAHAVEWLQAHGAAVRVACCIYPTAAFLDPEALRRGGQELQESGADYAFTVAPYRHPIERALRIDARGRAALAEASHRSTRTQDLQPSFYDAGQFYWGTGEAWMGRRPILGGDAIPLPVGVMVAPDIDTEDDWIFAECLFSAFESRRNEAEERHGT
jgi:pseudaminic acid cytidylyltransferase